MTNTIAAKPTIEPTAEAAIAPLVARQRQQVIRALHQTVDLKTCALYNVGDRAQRDGTAETEYLQEECDLRAELL